MPLEASRRAAASEVRHLGFVAMPNVWIFQIIFPLISPVMDLLLIYTCISASD
jgi:hypothetical protein